MNISSNTLFHFTKDRKTLESTLINDFWPTLCMENNYVLNGRLSSWAIPMVCFCDIPLGNIEKHMNSYGDYAIGLNYNWAKKNGINPVWYLKYKSNPVNNLKNLFKGQNFNSLIKNDGSNKGNKFMYSLFYTKKFSERVLKPAPEKNKMIRYYNEREWRFVPRLFFKDERLYLSKDEFNNIFIKDRINKILKSNPLCFTPYDINYIIVRKDSELLEMKHRIESIKAEYSHRAREILVTKLLSAQRIKGDF